MGTVAELLEEKGINYKSSGQDLVVCCLSPEHEDSNPSMRIDKLTGVFNCLSCGYAGNLFKVYNIHRNMLDIRCIKLKDKIQNIMQDSIYMPLGAEPFISEYRNIKPETFKHFEAFTFPDVKEYEEYKGRIVFPLSDIMGRIIAFQARYLHSDIEPKYLNKPNNVTLPLYPGNPKLINNSIILVEGLFDMINLYDKGLFNAVCTFGVSFGGAKKYAKIQENIKRLEQYKLLGANTIYIMYDGDKAGRKAAYNLEKNLQGKFMVEVVELPDNKDPGSMTQSEVNKLRGMLYG